MVKVWADGRWRWVGTYTTRREARAAEQAVRPQEGWGITAEAFCDRWLADYARSAPSTRYSYEKALNGFRAEFGKRRLGSLTSPEARAWATRAPYFQYRVVRTMYADALRDGLVGSNPFAGLRIPTPKGRKGIAVLSEPEVVKLADKALEVHGPDFGPTVRTLILVAGFCGLRPGELGGLEWDDVDRRCSQIRVARSLDAQGNLRPPKNGQPRTVIVPPPAREALAALDRYADQDAVFLTPRLRRFGKGAIHHYFRDVRAAFGRPRLQFYELRHACATLLLERGLSPEDVAVQLGHQDGGQLVRTLYGHPDQDRARARIAAAFDHEPVAIWSQAKEKAS